MKIVKVRFEEPASIFDGGVKIYGTYENGIEEFIVEYYPDEISISEREVIGKTKQEVIELKCQKDKNYLQS